MVSINDRRGIRSRLRSWLCWKHFAYLSRGLHSVQTLAEVHFLQFSLHLRHVLASVKEIAESDIRSEAITPLKSLQVFKSWRVWGSERKWVIMTNVHEETSVNHFTVPPCSLIIIKCGFQLGKSHNNIIIIILLYYYITILIIKHEKSIRKNNKRYLDSH